MNKPPKSDKSGKSDKMEKLDKKELKKPDRFVSWGRGWFYYLADHRTRFLPIAIGIVVLAFGAYFYDLWSGSNLEKLWTEYYILSEKSEPEKWDSFKKFSSENTSTRPGFLAAVQLGDHFLEESNKASDSKTMLQNATEAALF